ncbi:hypothetical protein COCON_G00088490 [Conger conger]|uniref:5'-3' exoribonuclease 1 n=1 Tax=Conger conger TaxID=82655 RepID=A0A9Q1DKL4_CONCO|nr:hypothetical protein COCON_G00088490 [Conger conger]
MGVPKFYRWISERYPCLSEVVKEHQIPEFDNLYLDMNGIIHQCSHPNDEDVHFRISEEKIFADIFHYLEVLFRIIKPRKVFFMAVDGVAPRAKMNQQRGRRFRSAKEAEDKIKKALEKGEVLPTEARFDSNCITPGTEFMARLQEQLKYFVHNKLSTDKSWQGVSVYLSGHETPGEGEHKIMEFIRSENARPGHDPNTRHCLYGLDADLIMLGLTSHEPHFSLLREEVRFGGRKAQKRITAPEETTFHLLHLSLMREYIDYEFSELKNKISFEYDLERIIDDWILMGFLVGNDFIPHLPHLHINHDALPLLYRTYISVLPSLTGYLNENGNLNLVNFQKYLEKLSEFDREHFSEVFVDLKWFESKVGNKYLNEAAGLAAEEARTQEGRRSKVQGDSLSLTVLDGGKDLGTLPTRDCAEEDGEEDDIFETEFRQYKRTYYMTKMGVDVVSDEFLANQALCYVEGIQWILHYYYHGVQSWSWYYPYHYAPFLSDVRNIAGLRLQFHLGQPFMPFQQLLGVLPAASKDLLPQSYQHLMMSEGSPIIEYYPLDFKTDLNGKQQEWEAVVLIPFIDEKRLLAAMEPYTALMSADEKARNRHTECALYRFDGELEYSYSSPCLSSSPTSCTATSGLSVTVCDRLFPIRQTPIPMDAWHVPIGTVVKRAEAGSLYFCGFPTLQHIRHTFCKKKAGVVVFQQSSRGENTILEITRGQQREPECDDVASLVLGRSVFVNWPHLEEARIIAVSDGETKFSLDEAPGAQTLYLVNTPPPTKVAYLSDKEQKDWLKDVQGFTEHFCKRKGIVINETAVVLYGQLLTGRKYVVGHSGQVRLEKQWAKQVLPFPYQTIVQDIKAFDPAFSRFKTLEELFPPTTTVFMVGNPYYGAMGEVQESGDVINEGRVRVVFTVPCEPQLDALIQNQHKYSVKYGPGYVLASRLGITSYLVSRFSGSIFIGRGSKKNPHGEQKANVGLNLKFNKKNEEVPGYTKRTEKEWLYSAAVEELLAEYLERAEKVQEITSWLKAHPVSSCSRASCDLQILDSGIVEKIEEELEKSKLKKSSKKVRVTVKPHLLFRPLEQQHGVVPDPDAEYRLFDRVVNVRESFTSDREAEVLYEVVFDEEFAGGLTIRSSPGRGYRLPPSALINLTHGSRQEFGGHKLTAIVKPQPASSTNHGQRGQPGGLGHAPATHTGQKRHQEVQQHQDPQPSQPHSKPSTSEFDDLIANLKLSNTSLGPPPAQRGQRPEPLSPQSFAMVSSVGHAPFQEEPIDLLFSPDPAPTSAIHHSELFQRRWAAPGRRKPSKNWPPGSTSPRESRRDNRWPPRRPAAPPLIPTVASELARICMGLGMAPRPAFIRSPQGLSIPHPPPGCQGLTVCQVKLASGLLVHGPQCQTENEAKEKAALFALQRLNSVGSGFPLTPPLFSSMQQMRALAAGPIPSVFSQPPGGLLMHPQAPGYAPLHWPGHAHLPHQGPPFYQGTYPGARGPAPGLPLGSHNQFIPLQVSAPPLAPKGHEEARFRPEERGNERVLQFRLRGPAPRRRGPPRPPQPSLGTPPPKTPPVTPEAQEKATPATPNTPRQNPASHTPGSASKRKPRKLAVNFEAGKVLK